VSGKNPNYENRQGVYLAIFSSQPANVRAQRVAQASLSCPSGNSPSALPQAASYSRKCFAFSREVVDFVDNLKTAQPWQLRRFKQKVGC
jgi:hypothetical protein